MKLREYIQNLNEFASKHPDYMDLDVIYASDEEGNNYDRLYNEPTPMFKHNDENDDYYSEYYVEEEFQEEFDGDFKPNVICIN